MMGCDTPFGSSDLLAPDQQRNCVAAPASPRRYQDLAADRVRPSIRNTQGSTLVPMNRILGALAGADVADDNFAGVDADAHLDIGEAVLRGSRHSPSGSP